VFNSTVLNTTGTDRSQYRLSTLVNGGEGCIWGFEGAFQLQLDPYVEQLELPEWMGGFGFNINVTANQSQATAPDGSRVVAAKHLRRRL